MSPSFSFRLSDSFLEEYRNKEPQWGFRDAGGNSVGEITFVRTYSRLKDDGTKERWWEVCKRVIEGMYTIQKDWCIDHRLDWNGHKAQASAQEAFDLMFRLKWTPPGRGLAQMGTPLVMEHRNVASLLNCGAVSTGDLDRFDPGYHFAWTTEALMLGIGIGFDTLGAERGFMVNEPLPETDKFVIPDTREGWARAIGRLVNSYLRKDKPRQEFIYTDIRSYGSVIKTFGGTASGPEPLEKGIEQIRSVLDDNIGSNLSSKTITDIQNIIGSFVVAGNSRRSAELALGSPNDPVFPDLKNQELYPNRPWRWMSNNSISSTVGMDYSPFVKNTIQNGEPGYIWLDTTRKYGRLADAPDYKDKNIIGYNPCTEQPLESFEMCCLVTLHLNNIENKDELKRAIKFAYLYGKTVTLMTTPWPKTNAVMLRNRRIGLSTTGVAGFVEKNSLAEYRDWANEGFEFVSKLDKQYSEWLGIRESIRKTTLKPEGSVSLLSGATPGVHYSPAGEYFLRAIRFGAADKSLDQFRAAGYTVEPDLQSDNTFVVYFPIHQDVKRSEKDVSIFEKIHLAAEAQKYWSDNGVSVTVSFDSETEAEHVPTVLSMYEGQLKAVSFLPMGNDTYPQQPYQSITEEEYQSYVKRLSRIESDALYGDSVDGLSERFCTTDTCSI